MARVKPKPEALVVQHLAHIDFGQGVLSAYTGHHTGSDFFTDHIHDRSPSDVALRQDTFF